MPPSSSQSGKPLFSQGSDPALTEDAYKAIMALGQNFDAIGTMFQTGEGTPLGLRMAVGGMREAADLLERVADEWERL